MCTYHLSPAEAIPNLEILVMTNNRIGNLQVSEVSLFPLSFAGVATAAAAAVAAAAGTVA